MPAYAPANYTGNGTQTDFTVPFAYLARAHVKAALNGVDTTAFSWLNSTTLRFNAAPANGVRIVIRRETPVDPMTTWQDGATILGKDLNTARAQPINVADEAVYAVSSRLGLDPTNTFFTADGKRVKNAADPVDGQDLVTKTWAETAMTSNVAQATTARSAAQAAQAAAETARSGAQTAQTAAAASQTAAANSATASAASATTADARATAAGTSQTAAAGSASAAAGSASAAATSATNAASSATAAATSATNAANSATAAAASATSAAASVVAAADSYDMFDDRYLGQKAADPTVDNDGNPLVVGALFFHTGISKMKVFTGSAWQLAFNDSAAASAIPNDSSVTGANVAAALNTLQTAVNTRALAADLATTNTDVSTRALATRTISAGGLASGGGDLTANRTITVTKSSQAQAQAGTDDATAMTPLRTVDALLAQAVLGLTNAWINGGFEIWQRGTGSTSCPAGSRTFLADRVWVNPAGAAVTQQRSTSVPPGARSRYSLLLTGATSVTTCNVGQRLEAASIPPIKRAITITAKIWNGSGADFTPSLLLGTPAASDNFTTVTNRLTQSLQTCTNNAWTTVTHTVDVSGYTNIDNGLQVEIQIPSPALSTGSKTVNIAEISVGPGTAFSPLPVSLDLMRCQRFFNNNFGDAVYFLFGAPGATYAHHFTLQWPVPMRTTPTITFSTISLSSCTTADVALSAARYVVQLNATAGTNCFWYFTYTASAEL